MVLSKQARRRLIGGAAAVVLLAVTAGAALRGFQTSTCPGTLIPAYLAPGDLTKLSTPPPSTGVSRIVVLNPASGPGTAPEPAYRDAITAAHRSGSKVLGYVATGYGARPLASAEADIDRYRAWYDVDGVFLDEASSSAAKIPYYDLLRRHVRNHDDDDLVIVNPGQVPDERYLTVADVIVTFEGDVADYRAQLRQSPPWVRRHPRNRFAHLIYGASRTEALDLIGEGPPADYMYVTDDALPNPWDSIAPYSAAVEDALSRGC